MDEINTFVGKIIADLLPLEHRLIKQRRQCGCYYLKAPLPLDSTSGVTLLQTQELYHAGPDAEHFFHEIKASRSAAEQDRPIFCCAATSGVGKTHLAYATGKFLTMVLIRVANIPQSANPFTTPWTSLLTKLTPLHKHRDDDGGSQEISAKALLYVKLLVCCYVDATVTALEIGKSCHLDMPRLRELALRFNRNGTGEKIVESLFESKCGVIIEDTDIVNTRANLRKYRQDINDRFMRVSLDAQQPVCTEEEKELVAGSTDLHRGELLLVCFDEIQELLNRFPRLFIQKSMFHEEDVVVDDSMSRDLFYGVACAMGSFTRTCSNWTMHMTGTHLSISKIYAEKGVSSSLLRNRIHQFPIASSLMTSARMKHLIQYYWDIADDTFSEEVTAILDTFRGRPYFFVELVFRTIFEETCVNRCLDSDRLITLLNRCVYKVRQNIERRIVAMFNTNSAIVGAGDRTVLSLIPMLLKTIICGTGKLVLSGDQEISQAIMDGVILASSDESIEKNIEKNLRDTEPLVYNGLVDYVSKIPLERLMNLVLNQIRKESGATAEEMFCYWIALTNFSHIVNSTNSRKGILLGDLLFPLYDGMDTAHFPKDLLNEYVCDATKVVNLENNSFVPSLDIVRRAGRIERMNTETIFFGIDESCGVDIVFVVKNKYDNHHKLVAIQSKNDKNITAKEVLMTLSPGLQYLEKPYRVFVVTGKFPAGRVPAQRSCGPGYARWDEWSKFCSDNDSSVGNNWIRLALVSRRIAPEIHRYISTKQLLERYDDKTKSLYWTLFASNAKRTKRSDMKAKAELAVQLSPLVFLSFSSDNWLSEKLKSRFINARANDTGMTFPTEKKKSKYWIPVSVATSECVLSTIPTSKRK